MINNGSHGSIIFAALIGLLAVLVSPGGTDAQVRGLYPPRHPLESRSRPGLRSRGARSYDHEAVRALVNVYWPVTLFHRSKFPAVVVPRASQRS